MKTCVKYIKFNQKYNKYKTKYLMIKHPEKTEQILSDTSSSYKI